MLKQFLVGVWLFSCLSMVTKTELLDINVVRKPKESGRLGHSKKLAGNLKLD